MKNGLSQRLLQGQVQSTVARGFDWIGVGCIDLDNALDLRAKGVRVKLCRSGEIGHPADAVTYQNHRPSLSNREDLVKVCRHLLERIALVLCLLRFT